MSAVVLWWLVLYLPRSSSLEWRLPWISPKMAVEIFGSDIKSGTATVSDLRETKQRVSASTKRRPSLPGLPWQSGHTSWATVGSQCCPCARGRSRGGTREASAAWPAGWWDSSRHPAGAPSGGAPRSPWWGPPVENEEHLECYEIYNSLMERNWKIFVDFLFYWKCREISAK